MPLTRAKLKRAEMDTWKYVFLSYTNMIPHIDIIIH